MKRILITGGPVHANLDSVKIITNRFKGGLIADLAGKFVKMSEETISSDREVEVTYLCSKDSKQPPWDEFENSILNPYCRVWHHKGLEDYMEQVLSLAPEMDAVILGAAVVNLIPAKKIEGKFPSHNYKPGDIIPIDFTIAPRVIDKVKEVNPKTHLFGFKLLSGVDNQELIRAAYGVLLESKAVTVFANDAKNLTQKYAVTKERGVHPLPDNNEIMKWILDRIDEKYYKTIVRPENYKNDVMKKAEKDIKNIIKENKNSFIKTDEGYIFGSAALKFGEPECFGFVTTARGKNKIDDIAFVDTVKHDKKEVFCMTTKKASLNAPLFHYIFRQFSNVKKILHFHHQRNDLTTLKYATPGTDKDSDRYDIKNPSFNIEGHGCILSYNENGELLI